MTGRTAPKTGEPVTLSSGITVWARKVSPYTMAAASKSVVKPTPPLIDVDYDGKIRSEPNEDDPAYVAALAEWQNAINLRAVDVMLRLGLQVDIDQEALAERRAELAALGLEIDADDHLAYVKHIAIQTEDDMTLLAAAITKKSQPTEEAVQQHLETFSDPTQGTVAVAASAS